MPDRSVKTAALPLSNAEISQFRQALLAWFERHKRDLPWRRTGDPYAIWISEIMLQQTRVAVVIPFYQRFLARFPDYRELAQAPECDLLIHWAGLGYYYRARNLQKAAQTIAQLGAFPSSYEGIRLLPGVGDYTAAAVASIAFGLPHAAVDGNVLRVLSRVLADTADIASSKGRKLFSAAAAALLDSQNPGMFNQALMELGATTCSPANPRCLLCPLEQLCRARAAGIQDRFPVKRLPTRAVEEQRTLYWIERSRDVLLWQRPSDSRLMPGFWELPEAEHLPSVTPGKRLGSFRHGITFHNYRFDVFRAEQPAETGHCRWVALDALEIMPISTILRKAKRISERKPAAPVVSSAKV